MVGWWGLILERWAETREADTTEASGSGVDTESHCFRTQVLYPAHWVHLAGSQRKGERQLFSVPGQVSPIWMPCVPPSLPWSQSHGQHRGNPVWMLRFGETSSACEMNTACELNAACFSRGAQGKTRWLPTPFLTSGRCRESQRT